MADTVGKRPQPRIPTSKGGSFDKDPHGGTNRGGSTHTKSPTGSRPTPTIPPMEHPPTATVPGAVKAPIKHTSMPKSKRHLDSAPKSEGGGSY